jgi:hypothetical protein
MSESKTEEMTGAKRLAELFAVMAFYLYFGGWVYASDLLAGFGLSLGSIETPPYYFIVYAYSVFFTSVCGWLLLLAVAAGWYALARLKFVWWAELLLAAVIVVSPFPLIRGLARSSANNDAEAIRGGNAKFVSFVVRPEVEDKKYPPELLSTLASGELFLVFGGKERYIVFQQPPRDPKTKELPAATVYDVPTEDFVVTVELDNIRRK